MGYRVSAGSSHLLHKAQEQCPDSGRQAQACLCAQRVSEPPGWGRRAPPGPIVLCLGCRWAEQWATEGGHLAAVETHRTHRGAVLPADEEHIALGDPWVRGQGLQRAARR